MWKYLSTAGVLAAALAAGPALAQQSPDEKSKSPMTEEQSQTGQQQSQTGQQQPQTGQQQPGQGAGGQAGQGAEQSGQDAAPKADKSAQAGDLAGQSVYSADGKELGEVTEVNTSSDGSIESIHVDIGTFLGIGGRTVEVSADQFTQANGRIELSLDAKEAEALPEVKAE